MLNVKLSGDNAISHSASDKVEQHFTNSATTYNQGAQLQNAVADVLLAKMPEQGVNTRLDLGCGPGLFTDRLRDKSETLISLDLSKQMLAQLPASCNRIQGNSHALPFQAESFDSVFSSLMIQWCDFERVLEQVYLVLKPGGQAHISTLINGSLAELQQAWAEVDDDERIHQYLSMEQVMSIANKGNWQGVEIEHKTETLWFDSVRALARELKLLGANYVQGRKRKGLMSKSKWQGMEQAYQTQFYCPQQGALPASYQVVFLTLRK